MDKFGPIIIIEDDHDDQAILHEVFIELNYPNEVVFFEDGIVAYQYLADSTVRPFLILSDINMPRLNGFQLRDMIHNNEQLRLKCIPYLFFTTTTQQKAVIDAYSQSVQGFFTKPGSYTELLRIMRNIVEYWKDCHSPNIIV
jgi:CheY-like chemotaxis protein